MLTGIFQLIPIFGPWPIYWTLAIGFFAGPLVYGIVGFILGPLILGITYAVLDNFRIELNKSKGE